jgi:hypothetical protein
MKSGVYGVRTHWTPSSLAFHDQTWFKYRTWISE